MFDFKLVNRESSSTNDYQYPMCAIVKHEDYIQFVGTQYILNYGKPSRSPNKIKNLIQAKEYSKAIFNNYTNDFYYFTYNNASDFSSGFSNKTVNSSNYYTNDVEVNNNLNTPFEFIDAVEIKEMKFLWYTKYVYYSIYNVKEKKTYHGVLDIVLNKIIFNTNEDINVFIPYSNNSMLAITNESAYRICLINGNNNDCLNECSSGGLILDINGNKCGTDCDSNQFIIKPEGICSLECDNYSYIKRGTECGLCRDLDDDNKYKLINGTECLSEVINGSEIYNSELFLLICKSGYILKENNCIPHCFNDCELCTEYSTNISNQKCISCKEGYYLDQDSNCMKIISTTIITNSPKINDESTYLKTNNIKEDSVPTINIESTLLNLNNSYNNSKGDFIINDQNETNQFTTLDEFKNKIFGNLLSYVNPSIIYRGNNFEAKILNLNDKNYSNIITIDISTIYLGICPNILKGHYNISSEEDLIILIIEESKNKEKEKNESNIENSFKLGINILLNIYDSSGRKLDLSFCDNYIKITHNISEFSEINIKSAINFAKQGIDVFNASDNFFNDLCHPFDDKEIKDIIINDRRNDIYQNATFCQIGCNYSGIDYELTSVNCLCNSSFIQDDLNNITVDDKGLKELLNFKKIKNIIKDNLFISNLNVIYCHNLLFGSKRLKTNIGFYLLLLILISQIIIFSFLLRKKLKPIQIFMLSFKNINKDENNNVDKKTKKVSFNIKKKKKGKRKTKKLLPLNNCNYCNKSENNESKKKIKLLNETNDLKNEHEINLEEILTEQSNIKKNIKKVKSNISEIDLKSNTSTIKSKKKLNKTKKEKKINNIAIETENEINIDKKEKYSMKISKEESDLNEMKFEDIINQDKRTFKRMFWSYLIHSKIILGTFFTENNLHLFEIKLSFFIYTFEISLFLNAFFYSDEYISNAYHNNGILDFVSGLPKSVYSAIASFILTTLLRMLSNSEKELNMIIKEKNKDKNYEEIINNEIKKLKIKLFIYYCIVFSLGLLFFYYVSSFCAVYKYSQKYWFFGFLESFTINVLVALITCLISSFFRYLSIQKGKKYFYTISKIVKNLT